MNITETKIYINGIPVFPAIKTDFTGNDHEGFLQILKATGERSCLLNMHTWKNQPIFAFDLTQKGRNALLEYHPIRNGNLRIELKFNTAVAAGPYTIILYGLMDSTSEIDADNSVRINWT